MHKTAIKEERLISVIELADYLSVPVSWVYARTAGGFIPCVHVGRYVRFRLSDVLNWLGSRAAA